MGQSNIWYADSGKGIDYKNNILKYIKKDEDEKNRCTYKPVSHQTDVILKKRECKIVCVNRYCMNLLYAPYWGKQR